MRVITVSDIALRDLSGALKIYLSVVAGVGQVARVLSRTDGGLANSLDITVQTGSEILLRGADGRVRAQFSGALDGSVVWVHGLPPNSAVLAGCSAGAHFCVLKDTNEVLWGECWIEEPPDASCIEVDDDYPED